MQITPHFYEGVFVNKDLQRSSVKTARAALKLKDQFCHFNYYGLRICSGGFLDTKTLITCLSALRPIPIPVTFGSCRTASSYFFCTSIIST